MIAALISGAPWHEVTAPAFWQWRDLHPQVAAIAAGGWKDKAPPAIRGTGFCIDALEAALWAVHGADGYRDAVLRAANLGDDADTTAAIAGQLAGARWGAGGIPEEWRARVVMRERIETIAEGLHHAGEADSTPRDRWSHDAFHHAWWVEPGRILAGEYPGDVDDASRAAATVNLLVDAGVRSFVDLTEAHELTGYGDHVVAAAEARGLDLRHERMSIVDFSTADVATYDRIVGHLHREAERGAVYLHCWGGIGRTGTVVGCLLVDAGMDGPDALRRLVELRAGTRKEHRSAPETPQQAQVVLDRAVAKRGSVHG